MHGRKVKRVRNPKRVIQEPERKEDGNNEERGIEVERGIPIQLPQVEPAVLPKKENHETT